MRTLTLRGIEGELEKALESEAGRTSASMNATITRILRHAFGLAGRRYHTEYHDLDHLAGTWTKEERSAFEKNTHSFSEIDGDMWK